MTEPPVDVDVLAAEGLPLIDRIRDSGLGILRPRPEQLDHLTSRAERSLHEFVRQAWHAVEPGRPMVEGWVIGCVAEHLQAVAEGQIRDLIINIPPGCMKPCYNLGMITEKTKGIIPLGEVAVGDEVLTHRGRFRRVLAVHEQGVLPLLEIATGRGRLIRVHESHPFLTARGWVEARHLTPRDVLAEVHKVEPCGTETVSLQEARVLGYLIGDGSVKYGATGFTNKDAEAIADFVACAESIGFKTTRDGRAVRVIAGDEQAFCPNHPDRPGTWRSPFCLTCRARAGQVRRGRMTAERAAAKGVVPALLDSNGVGVFGAVRRWRGERGLEGKSAYTKEVPRAIEGGTDEVVAEFLAAYWACDGVIHDRRDLPRAGRPGQVTQTVRVCCDTVSEALARGIQRLLTRLGLSFTLRRKVARIKTKRQGDVYVSWHLDASGQDTAAKFMEVVGRRMRHEKRGRAPGLIRSAFDHVLWPDPVVSISPAGSGPCRCLTVEEDSSFAYEGVAVHNSLLTCVMLPAWVWVRDPGSRWIFGAYGQGLAYRDSDRTRDVISSPWYQARWGSVFQMKRSWNTKERFSNNRGGYRIATTVAGKAMGERADYLGYDDAHKPTEVGSDAIRSAVIHSWTNTMSTRGSDPKSVRKIVIMQRLHERDLCGYLLAEVGGYEALVLPMEYEPARYWFPPAGGWGNFGQMSENTQARPLTRPRDAIVPTLLQRQRPELLDGPTGSGRVNPGDLLWPERFPAEEVEKLKGTLQGVGSAGQLQQRPSPAGGNLFRAEDFRRFTLEEDAGGASWAVLGAGDAETGREAVRLPVTGLRFFQVCDTALTDKPTSAYTCVMTLGWHLSTRTLLVWHVWRARLEVREQMEALRQLRDGRGRWDVSTRRWLTPGAAFPWPKPLLYQAVEEKASGYGLLQEARAQGIPFLPLRAIAGKAQRAAAVVTMMRNGKVWFMAAQPWLVDFEDELCTFPNGAFSDGADCLGYAGIQATTESLLTAGVEGDLTVWPPTPRDKSGRPMGPLEVANYSQDVETLDVGGVDVTFDDREEDGYGRDGW